VQTGYARRFLKTQKHNLAGEIGYEFMYIQFIPPDITPPDFAENVFLHSARLFIGYALSINSHTTMEAGVEALINLHTAHIGDKDVGPAAASRLNARVAFLTKIWKPLSLRASISVRYNNAPGLNTQILLAQDYVGEFRYNEKLDTLTEVGLILNFI
jgi:hypothetical protein